VEATARCNGANNDRTCKVPKAKVILQDKFSISIPTKIE